MDVLLSRHDQSLTLHFQPFSFQDNGRQGLKFQSNHDLFLPITGPHPRASTRSPLIKTKDCLIPQEITGFQEPCVRNWGQRLIYILLIINHNITHLDYRILLSMLTIRCSIIENKNQNDQNP